MSTLSKCHVCGKKYVSSSNRNYHIRLKHPSSWTPTEGKGRPTKVQIEPAVDQVILKKLFLSQQIFEISISSLEVGKHIYDSQQGLFDDQEREQVKVELQEYESQERVWFKKYRQKLDRFLKDLQIITNLPQIKQFCLEIILAEICRKNEISFKYKAALRKRSFNERQKAALLRFQALILKYSALILAQGQT